MDNLESKGSSNHNVRGILDRLKAGEPIQLTDPEYPRVWEIVARTLRLSPELNASVNVDQIRQRLGEIIGSKLDESTIVLVPFYTNFGRFIQIGKNVFINHACTFLDQGGITVEDNVLIGPKVNLITENHPIEPSDRRALICKPIVIKRNAWIGVASTILPGVTVGENAIVAAGAVVSKNVPANTVVGGIPAKHIKTF